MAGTTRYVRAMGRPDSLEAVLPEEFSKLVDDLAFVVDAVNTANGGPISIDPNDLTAGKIQEVGSG